METEKDGINRVIVFIDIWSKQSMSKELIEIDGGNGMVVVYKEKW